MADDLTDDLTDEEDLSLEPQQAGLAFRAEMWAMDTLMGYWPYALAAVIAALVLVLIYSQYSDYSTQQQRDGAARVSMATSELEIPLSQLPFMKAFGTAPDPDELSAIAEKLEAAEATGTARAEALIKAAELYRIADKKDDQKRVLAEAVTVAPDVLQYAAKASLANVHLELGENDEALQVLEALMTERSDYLGEQAGIDRALVLEQLDRKSDAIQVYDQIITRWPDSPRKADTERRKNALGAG